MTLATLVSDFVGRAPSSSLSVRALPRTLGGLAVVFAVVSAMVSAVLNAGAPRPAPVVAGKWPFSRNPGRSHAGAGRTDSDRDDSRCRQPDRKPSVTAPDVAARTPVVSRLPLSLPASAPSRAVAPDSAAAHSQSYGGAGVCTSQDVSARQMVVDVLLVALWGALIPGLMWLGAAAGF